MVENINLKLTKFVKKGTFWECKRIFVLYNYDRLWAYDYLWKNILIWSPVTLSWFKVFFCCGLNYSMTKDNTSFCDNFFYNFFIFILCFETLFTFFLSIDLFQMKKKRKVVLKVVQKKLFKKWLYKYHFQFFFWVQISFSFLNRR